MCDALQFTVTHATNKRLSLEYTGVQGVRQDLLVSGQKKITFAIVENYVEIVWCDFLVIFL